MSLLFVLKSFKSVVVLLRIEILTVHFYMCFGFPHRVWKVSTMRKL